MRSTLAFLALALCAGCPASTVVDDLAIVTGCHQPQACIDPQCACNRGDVMPGGACITCQPNVAIDNCGNCGSFPAGDHSSQCREPSQICYGRGTACSGAGKTCVPAGSACGVPEAAPPEPVASEDGGVEMRCTYADDVCCDAPDLGVPDMASTDLSAVVPMDLASPD